MNPFGRMAMAHWQRWLPTRYSQLENPETYFEDLGTQVEQQIVHVSLALAGDDPPEEGFLEKVGRLRMARFRAEEQVLREMVLLQPETGADPDEDAVEEEEESLRGAQDEWIPMKEDPTHPWWQKVAEEEAERRKALEEDDEQI
jgi:hypothetical protein